MKVICLSPVFTLLIHLSSVYHFPTFPLTLHPTQKLFLWLHGIFIGGSLGQIVNLFGFLSQAIGCVSWFLLVLGLCHVPSFMPSTSRAFFDSNSKHGSSSHGPHFAAEETEALRVWSKRPSLCWVAELEFGASSSDFNVWDLQLFYADRVTHWEVSVTSES